MKLRKGTIKRASFLAPRRKRVIIHPHTTGFKVLDEMLEGTPVYKYQPELKKNAYICEKCCGILYTQQQAEGVTPFMIGCFVTKGCKGTARSMFHGIPQDDPRIEFKAFWIPNKSHECMNLVDKFGRNLYA